MNQEYFSISDCNSAGCKIKAQFNNQINLLFEIRIRGSKLLKQLQNIILSSITHGLIRGLLREIQYISTVSTVYNLIPTADQN